MSAPSTSPGCAGRVRTLVLLLLFGTARFERQLLNELVTRLLAGAGPAAAGAIIGSAIPLAAALSQTWQCIVLAGAAIALPILRRNIGLTRLTAGTVGAVAGLVGALIPHEDSCRRPNIPVC